MERLFLGKILKFIGKMEGYADQKGYLYCDGAC